MGNKNLVETTLEQDLRSLGLSSSVQDQMVLAGVATLGESVLDGGVQRMDRGVMMESTEAVASDDPIDGPVVTRELFNRMAALPFERMSADDCDALLEELKAKDLPEGDDALRARAEEVVGLILRHRSALEEASMMRYGKGSMRKIRVKKHLGAKARKEHMAAKKYRRTHKTQIRKSMKKMERKAILQKVRMLRAKKSNKALGGIKPMRKLMGVGSRGPISSLAASAESEIARDLRSVLSESRVQAHGVRAEVVERLNAIFALISEMYASEDVNAVLEEAFAPVVDRASAGSLTEDTLDDAEFVSVLTPCLNLVTKVMESVETGDVDFDFLGEDDDLGNGEELA
jgi:hypothetical protein